MLDYMHLWRHGVGTGGGGGGGGEGVRAPQHFEKDEKYPYNIWGCPFRIENLNLLPTPLYDTTVLFPRSILS